MEIPRIHSIAQSKPLIQHVQNEHRLGNYPLKPHIRQRTQRCDFTHNRADFAGESMGNLLAATNGRNNIGRNPDIAKRTITCARCDYRRTGTEQRYILHPLRPDNATALQTQITQMQNTEVMQDHVCHPCQQRAGNPFAAIIAAPPNSRIPQYAGARTTEDNGNPPALLRGEP